MRWAHMRCPGCGAATAHNAASAHARDFASEEARSEAIYVEDMVSIEGEIERMQAESTGSARAQAAALQLTPTPTPSRVVGDLGILGRATWAGQCAQGGDL